MHRFVAIWPYEFHHYKGSVFSYQQNKFISREITAELQLIYLNFLFKTYHPLNVEVKDERK